MLLRQTPACLLRNFVFALIVKRDICHVAGPSKVEEMEWGWYNRDGPSSSANNKVPATDTHPAAAKLFERQRSRVFARENRQTERGTSRSESECPKWREDVWDNESKQ